MKIRKPILLTVVASLLLSTLFILFCIRARRKPALPPEIGLTGWPMPRQSPAERERGRQRAMQMLREEIVNLEREVTILRAEAATPMSNAELAQRLEKQEKILDAMKRRLADEESASTTHEGAARQLAAPHH